MIRAVIVDDEPLGRLKIRELLRNEHDIEIVAEYGNAQKARVGIGSLQPDLLFLDIQMPRGNAFTILDGIAETRTRLPVTIFITAHEQYALQAFDVEAADYLLKPFNARRFVRSLERARQQLARRAPAAAGARYLSRLAVKSSTKVQVVRMDDVDWIETAGKYICLHAGRESHLHRASLVQFESQLDPEKFIRIHQSAIVHLDRIVQLEPSFNRTHVVHLRDGTRLTLSAPYRNRVQSLVGRF